MTQAPSQTRLSLWVLGLVSVAMLALQSSYGLCLQDDAYISFRYARNAALGQGLVYNVGEAVEGYTNFLWTVMYVPVEWVGLDPGPVSALLGALFTVALLHATWQLGGKGWLAPLLVATFPGLALEGVQGLETTFYAWLIARAILSPHRWALWAGLCALTRPEGYAVFGILWLLRGGPSIMDRVRHGAAFCALAVPHLVFRVAYYGDIVPNTFHAKVGGAETLLGPALLRGLSYVATGLWSVLPLALGVVVAVAVSARRRRWLVRENGLEMVVLAGFFLGYVVMVGGDFKGTGRFVIPWLPVLAVFAQAGLASVSPPHTPKLWGVVAVAGVLWSVPGWQEMGHFAERFAADLERRRTVGLHLSAVTSQDTVMAVHAAGILPYYAERTTIDMWGLNDAHIARAPVDGLGTGIAGHERHDYAYVLDRAPHIILPEQGLVTGGPVRLADPGVFPEAFATNYRPVSVAVEEGTFLNLWLRHDLAGLSED